MGATAECGCYFYGSHSRPEAPLGLDRECDELVRLRGEIGKARDAYDAHVLNAKAGLLAAAAAGGD